MTQEFYQDLKKLISYKSVLSKPLPGMPFGEGVAKALNCFKEIAQNYGFNVKEYDGYALEIEIGKGEELGIIGHLDVVPEGTGWNTDPYTLTEKDGFLYARGIEDDKGPLLQCLYAIKELKEEGVKFNRKIRFFAGTNEESGWKDIEYLKTKTKMPEFGFSPDGDFPCTYAEKGVYPIDIYLKKPKNFFDIKGGTVRNAVCAYAEMKAEKAFIDENLIKELGLTLNGNTIKSYGIASHGSRPQEGKNAIKPLFYYMVKMGEYSLELYENLFQDKQQMSKVASKQGNLTFSPDIIETIGNELIIKVDVRLPAPFEKEEITSRVDKFGVKYTIIEAQPTMMVNPNDKEIKIMTDSYNKIMGTNEKPIAIGGSTYARVFNKGVSFGISMPSFYKGTAHISNENIPKEIFEKSYEIYKTAIREMIK